jgi:hypothetical protein
MAGLAVLFGCFAATVLVVTAAIFLLPNDGAGGCMDICVSSWRSGALVLALIFGLPAVGVGLVVSLVIFTVRVRRGQPPVAAGRTAGGRGVAVFAAVLIAVLAVWALGNTTA